jgi:hypothetical protein
VPRIVLARRSPAPTFDFYIGPNGDDNNPGTLGSPWSISALNSRQSTYAGKRVGIIGDQGLIQYGRVGGVATSIYASIQAQSGNNAGCVFQVNGGVFTPTYIASCNSSGVYVPRLAVIDGSNPSGGAAPTVSANLLGQSAYLGGANQPANWGMVTIDGLVVRNWTYSGIQFYGTAVGGIQNVLIENSEVYNTSANVVSNGNPGAIWLQYGFGVQIVNCKVHDLTTSNTGSYFPYGLCPIMTFQSYNTLVQNCSFFNCAGPCTKDLTQSISYRYCRMDCGSFGSAQNTGGFAFGISGVVTGAVSGSWGASSATSVVDHCILIGTLYAYGQDGTQNQGTVILTNNTLYNPVTVGTGSDFNAVHGVASSSPAGTYKFQNNLVWSEGTYASGNHAAGAVWFEALTGITPSSVDYNAYGSNSNAITFAKAFVGGSDNLPLSTWQSAGSGYGFDTHSTTLASSPFVNSLTSILSDFSISGPALTAGVGGVACGAMDGSGLVGCNF